MRAFIFADRSDHALQGLLPETCPALLPVAGKPLIEHNLEEVAAAGIKDVTVFVGPQARALRRLLGHGERWGLDLSIQLSRGDEDPYDLSLRVPHASGTIMALRGDELRSYAIRDLMLAASSSDQPLSWASAHQDIAAILCVSAPSPDLRALWRSKIATALPVPPMHHVVLHMMQTPDRYLEANRRVLQQSEGAQPGGLQRAPGLRLGRNASLQADQLIDGQAYLGDHSQVHASTALRDKVIIGAQCYVDEHSTLQNCVVLPGTYVGAGLHLQDAIIGARGILNVVSGRLLPLPDTLWLDSLVKDSPSPVAPLSERLLAAAALLLVPLLPLRTLTTAESGMQTMTKAATGCLRVLRGHLRLFGSRAESIDAATPIEGSVTAPAGLISLAALCLPSDTTTEERWLTEFSLARLSLPRKLLAIIRARFQRRLPLPPVAQEI